jgi:hypothetical protein
VSDRNTLEDAFDMSSSRTTDKQRGSAKAYELVHHELRQPPASRADPLASAVLSTEQSGRRLLTCIVDPEAYLFGTALFRGKE